MATLIEQYKAMKIAIHHRPGSFSERWIEYCKIKGIPYKIVDAYDTDIIKQIGDCDAFMWHHYHDDYRDSLFAKELLYSVQSAGKKVFPDFNTGWHFDDKVGQKYLLESIDAPLVPSYVFYDKEAALKWIDQVTFPKVFKLRGGAGASNVRLVKTKGHARKLIRQAFGSGFGLSRWSMFIDELKRYKQGHSSFRMLFLRFGNVFVKTRNQQMSHRIKGYVYFQDFIPNNDCDIRTVVIGDKAFAVKRLCRQNDFRASGSGNIVYEKASLDERCIKQSFLISQKKQMQCIAFDWVFDNETPKIIEISYGFAINPYDSCPGYWTSDMEWHEGQFNPQAWMVEQMLQPNAD